MREIRVSLRVGQPPAVAVDGQDLGPVAAVRVLGNEREIPAVQVEFRGEVTVDLPEGGLLEHMAGGDVSAVLLEALQGLDPEGLESEILSQLGGLEGGAATTGEAAKAALLDWARGYGSA